MKSKIPQNHKKIQRSLAKESGKILKKDIFKAGMAAGLLMASQDVVAGHSNTNVMQSTYTTSSSPIGYDFYPADTSVPRGGSATNTYVVSGPATCDHASGIVNGHFSNIPGVNQAQDSVDFTKSHGNTHNNHSNHNSCRIWM